jgi:small-conductance mechanosensitive channel
VALGRSSASRRLAIGIAFAVAASAALIVTYIFLDEAVPRLTGYSLPTGWLILIEAVFAIIIGYLFARALGRAVETRFEGTPASRHTSTVRFTINIIIGLIVLAVIFSIFGVSPTSILFGGAVVGLIVGLAGQTALGNLFAGFVLIFVQPFAPGDRISLVSSNWAVIPPSYAHEAVYPQYTGVVRDIGLFYTVLELEGGRPTHVANQLVITALIINSSQSRVFTHRIRMTFPLGVPVRMVEEAAHAPDLLLPIDGHVVQDARLEIAELGPQSWDGVIILRTEEPAEERVRDAVIRRVLSHVSSDST